MSVSVTKGPSRKISSYCTRFPKFLREFPVIWDSNQDFMVIEIELNLKCSITNSMKVWIQFYEGARKVSMPRLSIDARDRIILLFKCGYSVPFISLRLTEENIVLVSGRYHLVEKYRTKGIVKDLPWRKQPRILS